MAFFSFLFNTFQERVNLKTVEGKPNKYYLPDVLSGIDNPDTPGKKLLPLTGQSWDMGKIKGAQGRTISSPIASWYSTYLTNVRHLPIDSTVGIPNPDNPDPSLNLPSVTINGLNNISLLPNPKVVSGQTGYTTTVSLGFNSVTDLEKLNVSGDFLLQQAVCRLDMEASGNVCDGYCENVRGTGNFKVNFIEAMVDADLFISISGKGNARQIMLQINKLTFKGNDSPDPKFTVDIVDIKEAPDGLEQIWVGLAESAFDSAEAKQNMIINLNTILNTDHNKNSLADTLLSQLKEGLNAVFGESPASGLPNDSKQNVTNPADLYLFDRVRASLNNPGSDYYVPDVLAQNNNPTLEPFRTSSIDLGDQKIAGLPWGPNVLSNIVITGLSNNTAPAAQMVLQEPDIHIKTNQGQLNPPPSGIPAPPLVIKGDFSFTPRGMDAITGTFTVDVTTSNLNITGTATGDRIENLVISVSELQLVASPQQMDIKLSFPPGSGLGPLANKVVEGDNVKTTIISNLNEELSGSSVLQQISEQLTNSTKSIIISQLGGSITTH